MKKKQTKYKTVSVSKKQIRQQVKESTKKPIQEDDLPYSNIFDLLMDLSERWR
tara:strand:+ start:894 stop:1052 length:159 start_codon:yes stop_codon:yes gene_type:complete